ncbi:MAG: alpha/beta fold hydrolase, partial [Chloroflexi bacterium]|nr:alpha/beta fold hydrolase [Chloroflexota bacterium]
AARPTPTPGGPLRVLPAARHLAKEHNLDLATIQGSGPNGTITKADVERALAVRTAAATPRPLQKIAFYSEGYRLDGLLYSPANLAPGEKRPGVVLCVGYTYLKTMVAPDLAKALNQAGYVALLFDYRGFGDSEGPRWRLMPQEQVNDVRAALTFLADQAQVNPEQLAVAGISLGGAHAITVGALDARVGAVVAIESPGHGERWLRSLRRHTEWLDFRTRLAQDRLQRVRTGQSERVDPLEIVLPDPGSRAFLENVAREFPQMKCDLPLETADALIDYRPEAVVRQVAPRPLLLIHGDNDRLVPVEESRSLFAHAGELRRLAVMPGMDHFDWVMPNSPGFRGVATMMVEFLQEFLPIKP